MTPRRNLLIGMAVMAPRWSLLIGVVVLALAVMESLTGQSLGRFGRTYDRVGDPQKFWGIVATHYIAGLLFIGWFLHQMF